MINRKAQGGPQWVVIVFMVALVTGLILLGITTGFFRKTFSGTVSPLVDKLGEQSCFARAKLGEESKFKENLIKCCDDLYTKDKSKLLESCKTQS